MRAAAVCLLPLALTAADRAPAELATDYAREVAWQISTTRRATLETTASSFEVDGEPQERPGGGFGGAAREEREVVHTDRVLAHADGAPTRVRRSFETLAASTARTFGEEETERVLESPFAGVVVELALEEGGVAAKVVEGDDVGAEALAALRLELALDALLPEGDVGVGEPYAVDGDALLRALGLDLDAALFPPPPPEEPAPSEGGRGRGRGGFGGGRAPTEYLAGLEWEVELALAETGVETEQGPAARIELEAKGSGGLPPRQGGGGRGGTTEGTVTVELEGELLFLIEARLPASLAVEGTLAVESESVRERQDGGEIRITRSEAGELAFEVAVERAGAGD